jgi:hypothetical protein
MAGIIDWRKDRGYGALYQGFGDAPAAFRRSQSELLGLCDTLEAIADSLPANLDRRRCVIAGEALESMLGAIHRFEEEVIFPLAREALVRRGDSIRCIERLEAEHCEDEGFADELAALLQDLASGRETVAPETAGYMLRGFFVSLRRHVAFERDHLLAIL